MAMMVMMMTCEVLLALSLFSPPQLLLPTAAYTNSFFLLLGYSMPIDFFG